MAITIKLDRTGSTYGNLAAAINAAQTGDNITITGGDYAFTDGETLAIGEKNLTVSIPEAYKLIADRKTVTISGSGKTNSSIQFTVGKQLDIHANKTNSGKVFTIQNVSAEILLGRDDYIWCALAVEKGNPTLLLDNASLKIGMADNISREYFRFTDAKQDIRYVSAGTLYCTSDATLSVTNHSYLEADYLIHNGTNALTVSDSTVSILGENSAGSVSVKVTANSVTTYYYYYRDMADDIDVDEDGVIDYYAWKKWEESTKVYTTTLQVTNQTRYYNESFVNTGAINEYTPTNRIENIGSGGIILENSTLEAAVIRNISQFDAENNKGGIVVTNSTVTVAARELAGGSSLTNTGTIDIKSDSATITLTGLSAGDNGKTITVKRNPADEEAVYTGTLTVTESTAVISSYKFTGGTDYYVTIDDGEAVQYTASAPAARSSFTVNGPVTNSNTASNRAVISVDAYSSFSSETFVNSNGNFKIVYNPDNASAFSISSFNNSSGILTIDVTKYLENRDTTPVATISGITFSSLSAQGTVKLVDSTGASVSDVYYTLNTHNEIVLGPQMVFVNAKWTDTDQIPTSVTYNNRTYYLKGENVNALAFGKVQDAVDAASTGSTIVFYSTGGSSDINDFKFYPQGLVTINKDLFFESNTSTGSKAVKFDALKVSAGCKAEFRTGLYSLEDFLDNEGGTLKIVNKTRFNADLVKNANGMITLDKTSRLVAASIDAGVVEVRAGFVYSDLKWIERPYAAKIGDHATINLVYPRTEYSPAVQDGVVWETRIIEGKQYDVVVETINPGDQVYAKVVDGQYICYGTAAHHKVDNQPQLPEGDGWDSFYAATEYGGLQLIDDEFDLNEIGESGTYSTAAIYVTKNGYRTATLASTLTEASNTLTVNGTGMTAGNYSCSVTVGENVLNGKFVVDGDGNGSVAFMNDLDAGSYSIKLADPKYKATVSGDGVSGLTLSSTGLENGDDYICSVYSGIDVINSGTASITSGTATISLANPLAAGDYTVVLTKGTTFTANSQELDDADHRVTVSAEFGGNPIVYDSFVGALNSIYIQGHTIGKPESGMVVRLQSGTYTEGDFSIVLGETTQSFVGIGTSYNIIVEPDRWQDEEGQWHYDDVSMVLGGTFGGLGTANLMTFYKLKDLTIGDLVVGRNTNTGKEELSVVNFVDIENLTINYRLKPMNAATIRILNSNVTSYRHFSVPGGTLIIENSYVRLVGQTEHGALSTENNSGGSGTVILRNSVFELKDTDAHSLIVNLKVNCEFTITGTCTVNGIFMNIDEPNGSNTCIAFRDAILDENTNIQPGSNIGASLRFEGYNVLDGSTVEQNGDKDMTIEVGSTLDMSGGASITVGGDVEVSNCGNISLDNSSISAGSFMNEGSLTLSDGAEICLEGSFVNAENGVLTAELQSDGSLGITTSDGTPVSIENTGTIYIDLSKTDIPEDPYIVLEGLSGDGDVVVIGGGGEYSNTPIPGGSSVGVPHINLFSPSTETLYVNGEWSNPAVYKKGKNVGSYTYFGYNAFEDNCGLTVRDLTFATDTTKVVYYGGSTYSDWTLPRVVRTITTDGGTFARYSDGDVVKDDVKYYAWEKTVEETVTIVYTRTLAVENSTPTYTWNEGTSSFDPGSAVTAFALLDSITLTTLETMSTATLTATFTVSEGSARTVSIVVKDAKGKVLEKQNYSVAESASSQTFDEVAFYSSSLSAADASGYTVSIVDNGTTTQLDAEAWTVDDLSVDRDTAAMGPMTVGASQTVTLSGATMSLKDDGAASVSVSNDGTLKVETGESAKLVIPVAPSASMRDVKVVVKIGSNEEYHTVQAAAGADSVTVESKSFAPGQEYSVSVTDTKQYSAIGNTLSVDVVSASNDRTIDVVARNAEGVKFTFTNVSVAAGATIVSLDPSGALDNTSGSISPNFHVSVDENGILTLSVTGDVEAQRVDAYIQKTVGDTVYRFDYTFLVAAHSEGSEAATYTVSTRLSSEGYYYVESSEPDITVTSEVNGISGAYVSAEDVTNSGSIVVASQDTASGITRRSAKMELDVDTNDNADRWIEVETGGRTYSLFVAKGASTAKLKSEYFTVGAEYSDVKIKDAYSAAIIAVAGEGDTKTLTLTGLSSSDNIIRPEGTIRRTLKATVRDGAAVLDTYTITTIDADGTAVISDSRLTAGTEYTVEVSDEKTVVATAETLAVFDSTGDVVNNDAITVTDAAFNAGTLVNNDTITITNSQLTIGTCSNDEPPVFTGGAITNDSAITMDVDSLITAGSIVNNGTITIDATSFNTDTTDMKKVIDLDNTSGTITGTGNLVLSASQEQRDAGIGILYDSAEHDYWVVAANQSTVYVNEDWATDENGLAHKTGDSVGDKLYYGYNAFGSFTEAYAETLKINPYTLNGSQQTITTIEVYGPTAGESAKEALLFFGDNGKVVSDLTITVHTPGSNAAAVIPFNDGDYGINISPAGGVTLTIDSGITIRTTSEEGYHESSGSVYLNYQRTSGAIGLDGMIDSAREIKIYGRTDVSSTGSLKAASLLWINSGGAPEGAKTVTVTGPTEGWTADDPQVSAENIMISSGKLEITDSKVASRGLVFDTTSAATDAAVLDSTDTAWTLNNIGTTGADVKGVYKFTRGSITVTGDVANTVNNVSDINPGEVVIGSGVTLELANTTMTVQKGEHEDSTGAILNSGTLKTDLSSLITAESISNSGTITIAVDGFDGAANGMQRVIDLTADDVYNLIVSASSTVDFTVGGAAASGYCLAYDHSAYDYWVTDAPQTTLYVNEDWADDGYSYGDYIDETGAGVKRYYGYNAFSSFVDALTVASDLTTNNANFASGITIDVESNIEETLPEGSGSLELDFKGAITVNGSGKTVTINGISNTRRLYLGAIGADTAFVLDPNFVFNDRVYFQTETANSLGSVTVNGTIRTGATGRFQARTASLTMNGAVLEGTGHVQLGATSMTVSAPVAANIIAFSGNATVGKDATLTTPNNGNIVFENGETSITGAGVEYSVTTPQVKTGSLELVDGVASISSTHVKLISHLLVTDDWDREETFSATPVLNSTDVTWTIGGEIRVWYYTEDIATETSSTLNFTRSTVNVAGAVNNVAHQMTAFTAVHVGAPAMTINLDRSTMMVGTYDEYGDLVSGGAITNAGSIEVKDSTVSAASLDNDGTFTVKGTSELHIDALDGEIMTNDAAATTLKDSSITGRFGAETRRLFVRKDLDFTGDNSLERINALADDKDITVAADSSLTLSFSNFTAENVTNCAKTEEEGSTAGEITLTASMLDVDDTFTNESGATIIVSNDGLFRADKVINNSSGNGTQAGITISDSTFDVLDSNNGEFTNSGSMAATEEAIVLLDILNNTGSITVTNSTVSAASLDNDGTFTVAGTSELHIDELDGTITLTDGGSTTPTTLKDTDIYGKTGTGGKLVAQGDLDFVATTSNILSDIELDAAGHTVKVRYGTLTVGGESTLTIGTLDGTIQLDDNAIITDSTISAVDSENGGTLNVAAGNEVTFSTSAANKKNSFASGIMNAGEITVEGLMESGAIDNSTATSSITVNGTLNSGVIDNSGVAASEGGITVNGTLNSGAITNTSGTITVGSTGTLNATGITGGSVSVANKLSVTTSQTDGTISGVALAVTAAGATTVENVAVTADRINSGSIALTITAASLSDGADEYQYVAAVLGTGDNAVSFTVNGAIVTDGTPLTFGEKHYIFTTRNHTGIWLEKAQSRNTLYVNEAYPDEGKTDDGHQMGWNAFQDNPDGSGTTTMTAEALAAASKIVYYANENAYSALDLTGAGASLAISTDGAVTMNSLNIRNKSVTLSGVNLTLTDVVDPETPSLTVAAGGILNIGKKDSVSSDVTAGAITNAGTISVTDSSFAADGVNTSANTASFTVGGTSTLEIGNLYGTIKLEDGAIIKDSSIVGVQGGGTLLVEAGKTATFSTTSGLIINSFTNTSISNAGTIYVSGAMTSGAITNNGTFTVKSESTLHIGLLEGTITVAAGTTEAPTTLNASGIGGGTLDASAGGVKFTGANTLNGVTLNAANKTVTVGTENTDSLTVGETSTLDIGTLSGTIQLDGATIKDSTITSGGTLNVAESKSATFSTTGTNTNSMAHTSINNSGTITVNDMLTVGEVTNNAGATIMVNNNSDFEATSLENYGTITASGSSAVIRVKTVTLSATSANPTYNYKALTIQDGAQYEAGYFANCGPAGTLTVTNASSFLSDALDNLNGGIITVTDSSFRVGTVVEEEFQGGAITNNGTINISGNGSEVEFGALTFNDSGLINMDWKSALSFTGFNNGEDKLIIDMTGIDADAEHGGLSSFVYDRKKILDYTGSTENLWTEADYRNLLDLEETPWSVEDKYTLVVKDGDLWVMDYFTDITISPDGNDDEATKDDPDFSTFAFAASVKPTSITVVGENDYTSANAPVFHGITGIIGNPDDQIGDALNFATRVISGESVQTSQNYTGGTSLTINDGVFAGFVVGADRVDGFDGFATCNRECSSEESICLTINGGEFNNVIGGGMMNGRKNSSAQGVLTGNIILTINGGVFGDSCYIYGGSVALKKLNNTMDIIGDVTTNVNVKGGETIDIKGGLYAGSYGMATIDGTTSVVLSAGNSASTLKIHELWGGCSSDLYSKVDGKRTTTSHVSGNRTLSFTGFKGTLISGKIMMFTHLTCEDGSSVTLTPEESATLSLSDVANWKFEYDSSLTGNFINDFKDDNFVVDPTGFGSTPWTVMTNTRSTIASQNFGNFSSVKLGTATATYNGTDAWIGGGYALFCSGNDMIFSTETYYNSLSTVAQS